MPRAADDCFAVPGRRLCHAEAMALLRDVAAPVETVEPVDIFQAAGRVLAEPVTASRAIPAHTNAAVDGYAFAFRDYDPANGSVFALAGRAAAGAPLREHAAPGRAVRIFTGAIIPPGLDSVALQEDCQLRDGAAGAEIAVPPGLKAGANRRLAGEDVAAGSLLANARDRLRPQDIAILAAAGRQSVACFRKPRISVLSTGNEVIPPGAGFAEGKVFDANGPMLAGLFAFAGPEFHYGGILPDDRRRVTRALERAAAESDLLITSGGASLGEEDHVIASLREVGALSLWQLAIKPGRPMGVGRIGSCLCLALPGNPVAVFVCALIYIWPVLRRLAGEDWGEPKRVSATAAFEISRRKTGRREFFRGFAKSGAGGGLIAEKYERDGSGLISSLRASNGLIEIPEEISRIGRGDEIVFIPFSQFGIFDPE